MACERSDAATELFGASRAKRSTREMESADDRAVTPDSLVSLRLS
jgi:hypothetical protein